MMKPLIGASGELDKCRHLVSCCFFSSFSSPSSASSNHRRCFSWRWMVLPPELRWTSNVGGGFGRQERLKTSWERPSRKVWFSRLSHGLTQTASRQVSVLHVKCMCIYYLLRPKDFRLLFLCCVVWCDIDTMIDLGISWYTCSWHFIFPRFDYTLVVFSGTWKYVIQ